jgi:hypothetical protein
MFYKKPAIAVLLLVVLASCKPSKDDYRRDFVKGCVNSYAKDSTVANTEGRKLVEVYCNCIGDQLNAQMSADQWKTFNKSGDTTLSAYKQFIEPCKEDFQKKLSKLKP